MKLRPRIAAKAIIIRDGKLLLTHNRDADGDFYLLPGGGQEHGETLHDAMVRECLEEVGAQVTVGPLRFVRDYIGKNHEFADLDSGLHQVELMFECTVSEDYVPAFGSIPDTYQIGIEWIPLSELATVPLYPKILSDLLQQPTLTGVTYLGDTN